MIRRKLALCLHQVGRKPFPLFFSFPLFVLENADREGAQKNEKQSQEEKKRDCISAPLTRMIRPENEPKEVNIKEQKHFPMTSIII